MKFDYAKYFGEITQTHDLLARKDERSWLLKPPRDGERHDVVLYLGCNVLRTSHMIQTASILEDASPCMAANGVDPTVARGLVIRTFADGR